MPNQQSDGWRQKIKQDDLYYIIWIKIVIFPAYTVCSGSIINKKFLSSGFKQNKIYVDL